MDGPVLVGKTKRNFCVKVNRSEEGKSTWENSLDVLIT